MNSPPTKKSDLPARIASAIVMVVVAGVALWLGGWTWTVFVALVAIVVLWEWTRLYLAFTPGQAGRAAWAVAGAIYLGLALTTLIRMRGFGLIDVATVLLAVIAVDIGAYMFGRTLGGPKIAPKISPSKTWAGLAGGMIGAALILLVSEWLRIRHSLTLEGGCATSLTCPTFADRALPTALSGFLLAIVAQAGDFFESWMKRRAGVKDSSHMIPGHGGLFDRVDGLLAVLFVIGLISAIGL